MKVAFSKQFSRIVLLTIFLAFGLVYGLMNARAQTAEPELWITWQAKNYAPYDFAGKKLPTVGTPVVTSVALVDGEGRLADLSTTTIWWYWNNNPIGGGDGVDAITFRPSDQGDQELSVKVLSYGSQQIRKTISIPVVSPEAVIAAPFSNNKFSASKIQLQAQAYFFNVRTPSELNFGWMVNKQNSNASGDSRVLDITFSQTPKSGTTIDVSLSIRNPKNILETASKNKILGFGN